MSVYTDAIDVYDRIPIANEYEKWFEDEMNIKLLHIGCCGNSIKLKMLEEDLTEEILVAFKLRFA